MFDWLERRIDPFAPFEEGEMPPASVARFTWHYLRPVRFWLVVLFFVSIAVGLFETSLYLLIGWFVDLLAGSTPERLFAEHGTQLWLVAALILIVRPILNTSNDIVTNQILVPQTTNMVRWRTHLYTLGHSLSYFQSDFAGRIGNRITQCGPAIRELAVTILDLLLYVAIFAVTALGLFTSISLILAAPMAVWIAAYVTLMRYFVPRAQGASLKNAEARSVAVGRIVDSYTNILTVKLFARAEEERSAVRRALEAWTRSFLDLFRLITRVDATLSVMNSVLIATTGGLCAYLWTHGAMTSGQAATGLALVMRIVAMSGWVMQTVRGVFENVGVIQESMETIARPHAIVDAPDAKPLAVPARRGPLRERQLPLRPRGRHHRRPQLRDPARREGRARRRERRRQDHDRLADAAPARSGGRTHRHRRPGHRRRDAGFAAPQDRRRDAGHLAPAPLDPRQHRLRQARRLAGRDRARGAPRARARLHPAA